MHLALGECCFGGSSISFLCVTNRYRFAKAPNFAA